ncbi:MAG TPA: alpha/beta hydrolase [Burkholderiales bacterium]|nr:alpha/beta hydrolase [Burkholderiales bacterium]
MRAHLAAVAAGLLACACTAIFFQPHRVQVLTPDKLGLAYEEVRFRTRDGLELYGWFMPAKGPALGTVMQLHGNAENISTHFTSLAWMPARGFNLFAFDYRGYGASEGTPTLEGVQLDIDAALEALLERNDIDKTRIVMYGQSLGGALAAYYVAHTRRRDRIRALVLESAFSDYIDITREKFADHWFTWPFQWVPDLSVDDRFSPLPGMAGISPIPLLVLHGDQDLTVPMRHGRRLYDAAREPKQLWIVHGAGHIQTTGDPAVRDRLVAWLREVLAAPPGPKGD